MTYTTISAVFLSQFHKCSGDAAEDPDKGMGAESHDRPICIPCTGSPSCLSRIMPGGSMVSTIPSEIDGSVLRFGFFLPFEHIARLMPVKDTNAGNTFGLSSSSSSTPTICTRVAIISPLRIPGSNRPTGPKSCDNPFAVNILFASYWTQSRNSFLPLLTQSNIRGNSIPAAAAPVADKR